MHSHHDDTNYDELAKLGYDSRDVTMKPLQASLIGFFLFTIVSIALCIFVFQWARDFAESRNAQLSPSKLTQGTVFREMPNAPILQSNITAMTDIHELKKNENDRLSTYGWVDKDRGVVHIPIETAIRILSQRGLPAPTSQPEPGVPAAGSAAAAQPEATRQ